MLLQILDVDYILNNGKAVIRIFGKTENGKAICGFYDRYQPYFYIKGDSEKIQKRLKELNLNFEEVEKFLAVGYHDKPIKVTRVFLQNPQDVPKFREMFSNEFECFESDILFKYRFMVDFDLHGFDWIDFDGERIRTTHSKISAFQIRKFKKVVREDVPLKYLSVDIECLPMDLRRAMDSRKDPIIMISLAFEPAYKNHKSLVLVAKNFSGDFGNASGNGAVGFPSEKEMLEEFLRIIDGFDPDIITGYNINNFDIPYLLERLKKNNLHQNFGRCEKPVFSKTFGAYHESIVTGRVVADTFQILRRDVEIRFHKYTLNNVVKEMLGEEKEDLEYSDIPKLWSSDLKRLVEYARKDAMLSLKLLLEKNLLDKFFELSKISGVLLQDCFGGQTIRIENMALYEFKKRNLLMPSKPSSKELSKRSERIIKGAIVFEPKKGFYDDCVVVLDFLSLYPSIIKNYNISPDSLLTDKEPTDKKYRFHEAPNRARFVAEEEYVGVFPHIVKNLLETRQRAKKAMKSAKGEEKRMLNARQHALKILANSFYGYTGYIRARLFVADIANAITAYGRDNIENTRKTVEKNFPVEIIYGDTDALFIRTNTKDLNQASDLGKQISSFVSRETKLSFEFEKIYKTFLILTKKRYVGWKFEELEADGREWADSIEMRGIETVRRDWCPLVSQTMENIINIILKEGDLKRATDHAKDVLNKISRNEIPLEKLTVVKGITKSLDSYEGMLPHIEFAKKMAMRSPRDAPKIGDRLGFVIVRGSQPLSKRAEDPNYVKKHNLQIDSNYYIYSQLLPPIERVLNALGVTQSELLGNGRQISMSDIFKNQITVKTNQTMEKGIMERSDFFTCIKCNKTHRRIPLKGICDCGGELR